MRILYLDIDTLRPDHLGCYGYHRNTSPNIDRIASEGIRFENCYVSDAPCLPSRGGMFLQRFGINSGIVNHGGLCADPRPIGAERSFQTRGTHPNWVEVLSENKYPVSVSPFAERHSAWWFYSGWREMYNTGKGGQERADEGIPVAIDWLDRHGSREDWMLHVNIWDPHTPYRTPEEFGNPFADEPIDAWFTEELRQKQWDGFGPGNPQEPGGNFGGTVNRERQPDQITSMEDYRKFIDGYDCGIRYADEWIGKLLEKLEAMGILDDTMIIVTSDHGENLGELAVHGDHATADHITSRVPMIVRMPDKSQAGRVDNALHYQADIGATVTELCDLEIPATWDGESFADAFNASQEKGRDYLVVSNCAWSCQRAVRWDDYIYIHSYHTGLKDYPEKMLFNIAVDPHETNNLANAQPELVEKAKAMLDEWTQTQLASREGPDPLQIVLDEGGPFHAGNNSLNRPDGSGGYAKRLRETGRAHHAELLEANPTGPRA